MYQVQNPMQSAMAGMSQAAGTYGGMMKNIPAHGDPGHTAGGAIQGGMGGALAGGQIGTLVSSSAMAGPYGAAIGAVVGIGAYLLS